MSVPLLRRPWLALPLVLATVGVALLAWWWVPPQAVRDAMSEDGWVEMGTAAAYFVMAGVMWLWRDRRISGAVWPALCVVMAAFAARELDWHKAFTERSVLKVGFYFGSAPWQHKLAALAVLVPLALATGYLIMKYTQPLWQALRRREPVAVTVAVYVVGMVLVKMLDRSLNIYIEDFGGTVTDSVRALQAVVEETTELGLAGLTLLALLQQRARPS